jgi:inhibitor of KinA sporulation pathway (predicted exonuclease)
VPPEQPVRYRTMARTYVDFPNVPQVSGGDRRLVAALVSIMGSTTQALDDARQEIAVLKEEVSELKKARANDAITVNLMREDFKHVKGVRGTMQNKCIKELLTIKHELCR